MIGKSTIKLIKSLAIKKYRLKEGMFLVEGDKNVLEVLNSDFETTQLFATEDFISQNFELAKKAGQLYETVHTEIKKASLLQNPQNCIALCKLPADKPFPATLNKNISIYLDDIQDPGNLGSIIRLCDWFNIEYLFCSVNSVDFFNPKVIQATMGSFCRVNYMKTDFESVAKLAHTVNAPVFGTFMNGYNIYTEELPAKAVIVMGNEGNGISKNIEDKIDRKIKIPKFPDNSNRAESLNVAIATAVVCSEFKRRIL